MMCDAAGSHCPAGSAAGAALACKDARLRTVPQEVRHRLHLQCRLHPSIALILKTSRCFRPFLVVLCRRGKGAFTTLCRLS